MTDVEASSNAGAKRKSFSNKQGKKDSPKKFKPDNTKTPQKGKIFDKSATPKQQNKPLKALDKNATPKAQKKSPNKQSSPQKANLKNNPNSNSDSSKKLKPFAGTSEIQPSGEGKNKKIKNENKTEGEETGVKKRRSIFVELTSKVKSGDKEVIKTLDNKIQAIQGRGELTKTAKKKLRMLTKLKNIAEGKEPAAPAQQKSVDGRSTSTKRRDRKKKAIIAKETSETKSGGAKINGKANQKGKPVNKQIAKKAKLEAKQNEDSEAESEEDESDEAEEQSDAEEDDEESGTEAVEGESEDEEEGEESDEGEGEEDSDESDDEEESPPQDKESDSSEEANVPIKKTKQEKPENGTGNNLAKAIPKKNVKPEKTENVKTVNLDELKKNNLVSKNQKRFVLFVGNIPYETNKLDLIDHFKKCGEIIHIRIPTEKNSLKPRGFAYVEVGNEETYQKCLSLHHSFLKERRINVLYTQGGKKKGEEKKKEIKAKNFKLHAMRKQGKLAGSKKEVQKRSFRRAKQRAIKSEQDMNKTE